MRTIHRYLTKYCQRSQASLDIKNYCCCRPPKLSKGSVSSFSSTCMSMFTVLISSNVWPSSLQQQHKQTMTVQRTLTLPKTGKSYSSSELSSSQFARRIFSILGKIIFVPILFAVHPIAFDRFPREHQALHRARHYFLEMQ